MRAKGFVIKEILIENFPGTDAETGKMDMYIKLDKEEDAKEIPPALNIGLSWIYIKHASQKKECRECKVLYPEITLPHQTGEQ